MKFHSTYLLLISLASSLITPAFADRQATLGTIQNDGSFSPNTGTPASGDGVIIENPFIIGEENGPAQWVDTQIMHYRATTNGKDMLIPLGLFSSGSATITWGTTGYQASDGGVMILGSYYGDLANAGPFITHNTRKGNSKLKLRAVRYNGGVEDSYFLYAQYDCNNSATHKVGITITTNQPIQKLYNESGAINAPVVQEFQVADISSQEIKFNRPVIHESNVTFNGNVTASGEPLLNTTSALNSLSPYFLSSSATPQASQLSFNSGSIQGSGSFGLSLGNTPQPPLDGGVVISNDRNLGLYPYNHNNAFLRLVDGSQSMSIDPNQILASDLLILEADASDARLTSIQGNVVIGSQQGSVNITSALNIDGTTTLKGDVIMEQAQGDIQMGDYAPQSN